MTGFLRALRGEFYALFHRRSVRLGVGLVLIGSVLRVLVASWWIESGGVHDNFWPRFAQGARLGLILAEVGTLVLVASALPHEISRSALRDPLARRIGRPAFVAARALSSVFLPLFLGAIAVGAAAVTSSLLFQPGNVVTAPFLQGEDPAAQQGFQDWLRDNHLRADQVAARDYLMGEGKDSAEAAAELGIPDLEVPEAYASYVPILVFLESEIRSSVRDALLRALLPLAVLGLFALAISLAIPSSALAAGSALGLVLLFGVFLGPELGDHAWWVFADWLPGMGHDSLLEVARRIADGYTDTLAPPEASLRPAWMGGLGAGIACLGTALLVFPRKRL